MAEKKGQGYLKYVFGGLSGYVKFAVTGLYSVRSKLTNRNDTSRYIITFNFLNELRQTCYFVELLLEAPITTSIFMIY